VIRETPWYIGVLTSTTQTIAWVVIFFFASAAASSAYLTASEIFPLETRALAIAVVYAAGTAIGGIVAPWLFGVLIDTGSRWYLFLGYAVAAALMLSAAGAEIGMGVVFHNVIWRFVMCCRMLDPICSRNVIHAPSTT